MNSKEARELLEAYRSVYVPAEETALEEDQVDEAMKPGPRQQKVAAKRHDPYATTRDRANAHNIAVRNDGPGTPGYEKKSTGGKGARYAGYGDQGAGNKARRRAGQEPLRGNTRTEETEDSLRDRRMERGGVDGNTNYRRPPSTATGPKKKPSGNSMSAFDKVVGDLKAKYGDKAVMAKKTVKKEETEVDVFDKVIEFLCVEGYAETIEEAQWVMANLLDEELVEEIASNY